MFPKGVATFTNGSTVVSNISMSIGDIASVARGTRLDLGGIDAPNNILEAIDRNISANTLELREAFTGADGTYSFKITYTNDGLREAAVAMRETRETVLGLYDEADESPTAGSLAIRNSRGAVKTATPQDEDDALHFAAIRDTVRTMKTTAELQALVAKTGERANTVERNYANYILEDTSYVALTGDITADNGRIWRLLPTSTKNYTEYDALQLGVIGDGITDDTAVLQGGIRRGIVTGEDVTCRVTSRILCDVDNTGLSGSIAIVGDVTSFNRYDGQYANETGTLLYVTGANARLSGITLCLSDGTDGENTTVGIVLRGIKFSVENCELHSFNKTKVIRVESAKTGSYIRDCYIHDCLIDSTTSGQLTAIDVDDNRVVGEYTTGLVIEHNEITNMLASEQFEDSFYYQTDGINISHPLANNITVRNNTISFVGEAIDCFGQYNNIYQNAVSDTFVSGVKLINGASYNKVYNNTITRPRTYGITCAGAATEGRDVVNNEIFENTLVDINSLQNSTLSTYGIGLEGVSVSVPKNNIYRNNTFIDCVNVSRLVLSEVVNDTNRVIDNNIVGTSPAQKVLSVNKGEVTFANKTAVKAYVDTQDVPPEGVTIRTTTSVLDTNNEMVDGRFVASKPATLSVMFSMRTGSANAGAVYTISLSANGQVFRKDDKVANTNGDFIFSVSGVVRVVEGDTVHVYIQHTESGDIPLTASSQYSLDIVEV